MKLEWEWDSWTRRFILKNNLTQIYYMNFKREVKWNIFLWCICLSFLKLDNMKWINEWWWVNTDKLIFIVGWTPVVLVSSKLFQSLSEEDKSSLWEESSWVQSLWNMNKHHRHRARSQRPLKLATLHSVHTQWVMKLKTLDLISM